MVEAVRKRHARHVKSDHLRSEHCLELVFRSNTLNDCQHEIELGLVDLFSVPTCFGQLAQKPSGKVSVSRSKSVHEEYVSDRFVRMVWSNCCTVSTLGDLESY